MWEDRPTMSCTVLQLDLDDSGECVVFLLEAEKLLIVCEVIAKQLRQRCRNAWWMQN